MRAQSFQPHHARILINPNQEEITVYMAFPASFVLAFQSVGKVVCRDRHPLFQHSHYLQECIEHVLSVGIPLDVFLVLGGISDFPHNPIDFLNASMLEVSIVPA